MCATTWMRREIRGLFNFLFPPACALCLAPLDPPDPDAFCQRCTTDIPPLKRPHCPLCALPYPAGAGAGHHCQNCLQHSKTTFSGVTPIGPYEGLLREAIHRFKYRNDINLDRPLGHLLAEKVRALNQPFGLVIPVPLHATKLRQRGYNQAALIAGQLAKALDIRQSCDLLTRTRPGATQKETSARDRKKNVSRIFACNRQLQDEHLLLVDDVMTTGATARECSKVLLKAGAASVHVAVLARAPLR